VKPKELGSNFPNPVTPKAYYPAFLNLKGKITVVIGGGKVAERKVVGLLKAGSDVKVISPYLTKRIEKEKLRGRIKHIPRQYRKGDLKNAFLVIAATDSPTINDRVSKDAPSLYQPAVSALHFQGQFARNSKNSTVLNSIII
jgi:siroheme synthase-like protein